MQISPGKIRRAGIKRTCAVRTWDADRTTVQPGAKPVNDTPEGWVKLLHANSMYLDCSNFTAAAASRTPSVA
eukprot:4354137-Pyramimonas_sp.AAC.1